MFAINNDTYDAHAPKYTTFASMLLGAIEVFGEPIVRTHTQINYKDNHSIEFALGLHGNRASPTKPDSCTAK